MLWTLLMLQHLSWLDYTNMQPNQKQLCFHQHYCMEVLFNQDSLSTPQSLFLSLVSANCTFTGSSRLVESMQRYIEATLASLNVVFVGLYVGIRAFKDEEVEVQCILRLVFSIWCPHHMENKNVSRHVFFCFFLETNVVDVIYSALNITCKRGIYKEPLTAFWLLFKYDSIRGCDDYGYFFPSSNMLFHTVNWIPALGDCIG